MRACWPGLRSSVAGVGGTLGDGARRRERNEARRREAYERRRHQVGAAEAQQLSALLWGCAVREEERQNGGIHWATSLL